MFKALVIGCGNIGAMYDFENEKVLTHAKAFSRHPGFKLTVFDKDRGLAGKVAARYQADKLDNPETSLGGFDCVSICTPTSTHFEFLRRALEQKVKLIICEKPVSNEKKEMIELLELHKQAESIVLVNYFRRFLPQFIALKARISALSKSEALTSIDIRYQRGFLNNCSHALDLVQFLTATTIQFRNVTVSNKMHDSFAADPTLSLQATWGPVFVNILGLANVKFSYFEITLFFTYTKVSIKDAGNIIEESTARRDERFFQPLAVAPEFSRTDCIQNYMLPVIENAYAILEGRHENSNFIDSVNLQLNMLSQMES